MAFVILLFYIVVIYLRPAEWVPFMLEWQLLDWFSISGIILIGFALAGKKEHAFKGPGDFLMLGFFAAILLSHLSHTYMAGLIDAFTQFGKTVVMYFLFVNIINTERKFKVAVWTIILLTFALVIQGMQQLQTGYGWAGNPIFGLGRGTEVRIRWIGIFNDPNDLALAFVMAAGFVMALLFGRTKAIVKLISLPILAGLYYGIYLTNSRGGLLALGATSFFYFVRRTRKFFLGGIIGGLCVMAIFAFGPTRAKLMQADEESAYHRLDMWYEGIMMVRQNPLFGVGKDLFMDEQPLTAHNSFVLAVSELGFFGFFFYIALFYAAFKGLSIVQKTYNDEHYARGQRSEVRGQHSAHSPPKELREPSPEPRDPASTLPLIDYALGLQSAIVGFAAAAFFLSRTYVTLGYMLFALATALFHVSRHRLSGSDDQDNRFGIREVRVTGTLCAGMLAFILILFKIGL